MQSLTVCKKTLFFSCCLALLFFLCVSAQETATKQEKDKETQSQEKKVSTIEEIVVYGKIPAEQPLAAVSSISESKINSCTPKDLGEIMNYTSGTYVTEGQKDESQVQIRGLSSNRLTILYDGIPVYEPYFNTFDLKTMPAEDIENIRVIKGANSVLYGANSMGGVIDVITKRSQTPFVKLRSEFSDNSTYLVSGSGGYNFNKLDVLGSATWDHSNGFDWKDNGTHVLRDASDYKRKNLMGKIHYYPTDKSEIFGQLLFYQSDYGIPPATEFVKPRYWRFDDWQRFQFSMGSSFPIFSNGTLKARAYYVRHYNILDAYKKSDYKDLSWESTYRNNSYGAFILGEKPLSLTNRLRFSVNAKSDNVNTQSAVGAPWEKFQQSTYSLGAEDEIDLSNSWRVQGGLSINYLSKQDGKNATRANPLLGIRYSPMNYLSFYMSLSQKSHFPSMKSLYSTTGGNPDLKDETSRNIEFGLNYDKDLRLSGAVFYNRIQDLIQSYRLESGYSTYLNIGKAEIYGFEMSIGRQFKILNVDLNGTFLSTKDLTTDIKLDYVPKAQINLYLQTREYKKFSATLWVMYASTTQATMGSSAPFQYLTVPSYTLVNLRLERQFKSFTVYLKFENLLDKAYYAEPGFPMKARTISIGFVGMLGGNS